MGGPEMSESRERTFGCSLRQNADGSWTAVDEVHSYRIIGGRGAGNVKRIERPATLDEIAAAESSLARAAVAADLAAAAERAVNKWPKRLRWFARWFIGRPKWL